MTKRFIITMTMLALSACTAMRPPDYSGMPSRDAITPGAEVIVGRNQNVYALARKHNVSMREIIVLNDLKPPFALQQGQRLVLPSSDQDSAPRPAAAPLGAIEPAPMDTAGVSASDVTAMPLDEPVLAPQPKVVATTVTPPVGGSTPVKPMANNIPVPSLQPLPPQPTGQAQEGVQVPPLPLETAGLETKSSLAFVWPVQGPIISAFGSKGQGMNNDGINIGAPKGAPVTAASGGIVVYAGNEMKGFGNLVLIRHEGGWVTAYAHLQRILVTKDNVVAPGDMIGTVGTTGGVAAPQLHFETRQDGKPVDPQSVIKKAG